MKINVIAYTKVNDSAVNEWLNGIGVKEYGLQGTEADKLITLSGKRCYLAYELGKNANLTKVRQSASAYIDNLLASGHGSVLEHFTVTFAIEGVTRVLTAELNRHRAGVAVSEGSGRYIKPTHFDEVYIPSWLEIADDDTQEIKYKKAQSIELFKQVGKLTQDAYYEFCEIWGEDGQSFHDKKQVTSAARRLLTQNTLTGGVWTFNIRSIRHILELRGTVYAEEEIVQLSLLMLAEMRKLEPHFFADFEVIDGYITAKYHKV